jgi:uncharacterized protein
VTVAVVDTGPLVSAALGTEPHHEACLVALTSTEFRVFIPALVVTEVCQILAKLSGPRAEANFLSSLADEDVRIPMLDDWARIAELVRRYADFPLGAVDASVVTLAERLDAETVITLDRRHFSAIRPRHCEHLRLLP